MMIWKSADISADGVYRWRLDRWWYAPNTQGRLGFLMLNPSTADADRDDATIRKCIGFALKHGFNGITVVNLYAFRATDPEELVAMHRGGVDIAGVRNIEIIHAVGRDVEEWVCAWGCAGITRRIDTHLPHAQQCVSVFVPGHNFQPKQLGPATKTGSPRHPLMAPYSSPLIQFGVKL